MPLSTEVRSKIHSISSTLTSELEAACEKHGVQLANLLDARIELAVRFRDPQGEIGVFVFDGGASLGPSDI